MVKWQYLTLTSPSDEELDEAGDNGWEVYWTDGTIYKLKRFK